MPLVNWDLIVNHCIIREVANTVDIETGVVDRIQIFIETFI